MGSQSKVNYAYIAGFLDGDGSLMLQLKKRKDGNRKWRFMCTICLYQDSRHKKPLEWMQKILNIGYLSDRNDGITELRINGYKQVENILLNLLPFIKFKEVQARNLIKACSILQKSSLSKKNLNDLVDIMFIIQNNNYKARKKKTREEILITLGLTP